MAAAVASSPRGEAEPTVGGTMWEEAEEGLVLELAGVSAEYGRLDAGVKRWLRVAHLLHSGGAAISAHHSPVSSRIHLPCD